MAKKTAAKQMKIGRSFAKKKSTAPAAALTIKPRNTAFPIVGIGASAGWNASKERLA